MSHSNMASYSASSPLEPPSHVLPYSLQRKAYAVVESLLKSEAAFLTSLNIAIQVFQLKLVILRSNFPQVQYKPLA